jgi:hypothetical protein
MTPDLCETFRRNSDRPWTCTRTSMFTLGAGHTINFEVDQTVRPGELLGDYDLAAYLGQTCARHGIVE